MQVGHRFGFPKLPTRRGTGSAITGPIRKASRGLDPVGSKATMHNNTNAAPAQVNLNGEEDIKAELERLRKENEQLKANQKAPAPFSMKVSEKGAVSVYGLGRFPVTLYHQQWRKLLAKAQEILSFIDKELAKGTLKEDPEAIKASKAETEKRTEQALKDLNRRK